MRCVSFMSAYCLVAKKKIKYNYYYASFKKLNQ